MRKFVPIFLTLIIGVFTLSEAQALYRQCKLESPLSDDEKETMEVIKPLIDDLFCCKDSSLSTYDRSYCISENRKELQNLTTFINIKIMDEIKDKLRDLCDERIFSGVKLTECTPSQQGYSFITPEGALNLKIDRLRCDLGNFSRLYNNQFLDQIDRLSECVKKQLK